MACLDHPWGFLLAGAKFFYLCEGLNARRNASTNLQFLQHSLIECTLGGVVNSVNVLLAGPDARVAYESPNVTIAPLSSSRVVFRESNWGMTIDEGGGNGGSILRVVVELERVVKSREIPYLPIITTKLIPQPILKIWGMLYNCDTAEELTVFSEIEIFLCHVRGFTRRSRSSPLECFGCDF